MSAFRRGSRRDCFVHRDVSGEGNLRREQNGCDPRSDDADCGDALDHKEMNRGDRGGDDKGAGCGVLQNGRNDCDDCDDDDQNTYGHTGHEHKQDLAHATVTEGSLANLSAYGYIDDYAHGRDCGCGCGHDRYQTSPEDEKSGRP